MNEDDKPDEPEKPQDELSTDDPLAIAMSLAGEEVVVDDSVETPELSGKEMASLLGVVRTQFQEGVPQGEQPVGNRLENKPFPLVVTFLAGLAAAAAVVVGIMVFYPGAAGEGAEVQVASEDRIKPEEATQQPLMVDSSLPEAEDQAIVVSEAVAFSDTEPQCALKNDVALPALMPHPEDFDHCLMPKPEDLDSETLREYRRLNPESRSLSNLELTTSLGRWFEENNLLHSIRVKDPVFVEHYESLSTEEPVILAAVMEDDPTGHERSLPDQFLVVDENEGDQELLEDIDQKNRLQKAEIDELKNALVLKEKRIREYRILNEELKRRLREALDNSSNSSPSGTTPPPSVSELEKKVARLTHEVGMANKERYEYQEQIRALQAKLDRIQGQPARAEVDKGVPSPLDTSTPIVVDVPTVVAEPNRSSTSPIVEDAIRPQAGGRLIFEAAITDAGGKTREAFYTEFFIVKQHLDDILKNAGFKLSDYEGIKSYAELWARVRKNDFQYSQQQQGIRQALLAAVDPRNGRRVFTDINGNSDLISGLPAGSYFIIGTASLGQVGVTWSLPIEIEPRSDKRVALTMENSSWSL